MSRGSLFKRVSITLSISFIMVVAMCLFAENSFAADTEAPLVSNVNLWNNGDNPTYNSRHLVYHGDSVIISIEAVDESGLQEEGCSITLVPLEEGNPEVELDLTYNNGVYECETPADLPVCTYEIKKCKIYDKNGNVTDGDKVLKSFIVDHELDFDHPTYVSGSCSSGLTKKWKCKRCDHTEISNFTIKDRHILYIDKIIKEATCEEAGVAEGHCVGCSYRGQEKIYALGHEWTRPEYTWSDDYSTVTAYHKCTRDGCEKEETKVVETTKTEIPATVDKAGSISYVASFSSTTGFSNQLKIVIVPKLPSDGDEGSGNSGDTGASGTGGETGAASSAEDLQLGTDGTAFGAGASAAAVETALSAMKNDNDPAGTKMNKIRLRSKKQTKKSVTLKWTKVKGAAKYVVYGNRCGKSKKLTKVAEVTKTSKKVTKAAGKKIKKGKYYKFVVVAYDKNNKVITASKVIHVATRGGKIGNHKKIKISKSVKKKAKKLKKGKTLKLKAKAVAKYKSKKVKKHVGIRYESTNTKVAKVTKKGKVKAVGKGKCTIYVFAQNGVYKRVKVVVK